MIVIVRMRMRMRRGSRMRGRDAAATAPSSGARRRALARKARARAGERDQAGQNGAEQRQEDDGLIHDVESALHQIDVFNRDRAAVAEIDHQNGKPDGGFRRRDREHEQREDLADDVAEMASRTPPD